MRLFFDLVSGKFTRNVGVNSPISDIEAKRSPLESIEIQFHRNGQVVELSVGASGVFEIKRQGEFDSEPLTKALAWVQTGTGLETVYTFSLVLINDPLDAELGINVFINFTADAPTDVITSTGLAVGHKINVKSSDTLPAPLLGDTDYHVVTGLKLSLTPAGAPIDITTAGAGTHSLVRLDNDITDVDLEAAMRFENDGKSTESQNLIFNLQNDLCREGDVPPSTPPLGYFIFWHGVDDLIGFKAVPTASLQLDYLVQILVVVSGQLSYLFYQLVEGPVTDAEPGQVEPDDYNALTNDRHWEGAVGPSGVAGQDAGILYHWNTDTTATDPTTGKLKVNHATLTSATELYIYETDHDGNALAALLATWDDSTSTRRGRLIIEDESDPTNFLVCDITGTLTDNGTWDTFTIIPVVTGGTLTNNLAVRLIFIPKGDKGDTGVTGTPAGILYQWNTDTATTDPTTGHLKINNAARASATELYISETDGNSNALAGLLATFDDGTSTIRGRIHLTDPSSAANYFIFNITGTLSDNGTWDTFTIAHVASGGSFTNNLPLRLVFIPKGDKGDTGAAGQDAGFKFLFNSGISGDPTTGKYLFNNATFLSATSVSIHETDANSNSLAALLATLDDSNSSYKTLVIAQKVGSTAYFTFFITGAITDNGSYDSFPITPVASAGSISNGDAFNLNFARVGDKGTIGKNAGHAFQWNTSTGSGGPGGGKLNVDNGTLSSASVLYISETDADTNAIGAVLATWDDSTSTPRGRLYITDPSTPTNFAIFDVTGDLADSGVYDNFPISHVASGGTLTNNLPVMVVFIPKGDKGNTGGAGGTTYDAATIIGAGTSGVDIDLTDSSMTEPRVLTGNTTFDLINPVNGKVTIVHIKQAAANSYTATFADVDVWFGTGGIHPTQSTGFDVIDVWTFWYDGANLYGSWAPGE